MASPRRGEVWLVDLGMTAKVRTRPRKSQFEAEVAVGFLRAGVFDAQNLITIPHAKLVRQLGKLNDAQFAIVEAAVRSCLGLPA